jgi:hypothetical protein
MYHLIPIHTTYYIDVCGVTLLHTYMPCVLRSQSIKIYSQPWNSDNTWGTPEENRKSYDVYVKRTNLILYYYCTTTLLLLYCYRMTCKSNEQTWYFMTASILHYYYFTGIAWPDIGLVYQHMLLLLYYHFTTTLLLLYYNTHERPLWRISGAGIKVP